jgi:putative peptide zinc metalloprotease protein
MSGTSGNMDEYLTYNQRLIALQSELSGLTKTKEKLGN